MLLWRHDVLASPWMASGGLRVRGDGIPAVPWMQQEINDKEKGSEVTAPVTAVV